MLVRKVLHGAGFTVSTAANAEDAKRCLAEQNFDLVLVDYKLPDANGISIIERYAQHIPCILVTAMGDEKLVVQAMQKGAKDYVVKDSSGNFIKLLPDVLTKTISQDKLYKELNATRERLRKVFDEAPDLMVVTDADFKILDISKNAALRYKCKSLCVGSSLSYCVSFSALQTLVSDQRSDKVVQANFEHQTFPFRLSCRQLSQHELMFVFHNLTDAFEVEKAEKIIATISQEKSDLQEQNRRLAKHSNIHTSSIIGLSPGILTLKKIIANVSDTDANVLILGETGTGKELVAEEIHAQSQRKNRSLIKLNCAAIPENLVESELFGHVKGSFSGAIRDHKGRFELAHQGTLFLDEIGELSLPVQAKLLRVLQEGQFEQVGGSRSVEVDVRIVAATNRNLADMVQEGTFRADLFYRLNVILLTVPALRDRKGDISLLLEHFIARYSKLYARERPKINSTQMQYFLQNAWPGNIRELQNAVERLVVLGHIQTDAIIPADKSKIEQARQVEDADLNTLAEVERQHVKHVLQQCMWRISGDKGAAKILGLNPSTLRFRMQKLGLTKTTRNE
ncbi:MAG: DNA-binding NtrC family response regulator [Gammaproteobacteria bacterium]